MTTVSTMSTRELRRAETLAAAAATRIQKHVFRQREAYELARRHDIYVRNGGSTGGIKPPQRGDKAPPTATEVAVTLERTKLDKVEMRWSLAKVRLADIKGELRARIEAKDSADRESLALLVIAGTATSAQKDKLQQLCPDERDIPVDAQFTVSPQVALALRQLRGARDDIHTPVCVLNGTAA
jgi:hypothetical protein